MFAVLIITATTLPVFSQSRYLPLGTNGSSFSLYTRFNNIGFESVTFDAGYSIGGRMDLSLQGGVVFNDLGTGSTEAIPNFSFIYDIVMLKQQKAVPFSLKAGVGIGFASALPGTVSITGEVFGFNMLISHDIWFERTLIGLNGVFEYGRTRYEVTDIPTDTTNEIRLHNFLYGAGIDIGYKYYKDNLLVLRGDILWDRNGDISGRIFLTIVVPSLL